MSVTVEASLRIKRIQYADGACCIGERLTEVGEFRIKQPEKTACRVDPRVLPAANSWPVADVSADRKLFGDELYTLVIERKPVKLDPATDDRKRFRAQRNRLKSGLEYRFIPEEQIWYPAESDRYQKYIAGESGC